MAVQDLIIPEDHNRGAVDSSVLREYVHQSGGWAVVGLILGTMSGWLLLSILSNIQIEKWCEDY
jgi:ABC-type lipoprotein release transport system permease subunit